MKSVIAKKWVKALRSEKYKQGKGQLHNKKGDRYCCLGVLCDLYLKEKKKKWEEANKTYYCLGSNDFLPPIVQKWAGMKSDCGNTSNFSLYFMNDIGRRFSTIAKAIEENVKSL
jgi:hypothetical protein